ncbi:MAG: type II toxin-antitoxin system HicB family antitoxin [Spirochaetia bacterium]
MKETKRTQHFPVIIEQDSEGVFIIECPVLKGCRSYGDSVEEALKNIREAIQVCLEEDGYSAPETVFLGVRDIEIAI